jgi:hypothetical protein
MGLALVCVNMSTVLCQLVNSPIYRLSQMKGSVHYFYLQIYILACYLLLDEVLHRETAPSTQVECENAYMNMLGSKSL